MKRTRWTLAAVTAGLWLLVVTNAPTLGNAARVDTAPSKSSSLNPLVKDSAAKIDDLVKAGYAADKIFPTRLTTDEEFLRRVYLDVIGRIPTHDEAQGYLASKDPMRRQKLIDQLLDSPGYVSHMYNYWADQLRLTQRIRGDYAGEYPKWLKEQIKQNTPYDNFVYLLLTAEGKAKDNGAVGYWLRDNGMNLEITSQTTQIFLGTQIGCAQCHDHPFDKWEMKEFYEFAAFTSSMTTRDRGMNSPALREIRTKQQKGELARDVGQVLTNLIREEGYKVSDTNTRGLKLPSDYKYDNGKPGETIKPRVIFDDKSKALTTLSDREKFARWVTSKDNPLFAKVIANRMWARVMGIGIVSPVDDFSEGNKPSNPALLDYLAGVMKKVNFDVKEYMRIVLNTRTYQLATGREDYTKDNFRNQASVLRRMTAEQIWDSFGTITVEDLDERAGDGMAYGGMMMMSGDSADVDITKMSADQLVKYAEKLIADRRGSMRDKARDSVSSKRGQYLPQITRASEIRQPAAPGHFLREFGSSDREAIGNAHTDASVPQVLQLVNGTGLANLVNKQSALMKNIARATDDKEKVNVLFLSFLSRYPNPTEMGVAMKELKDSGSKGIENLIWALANTREFLFIR
ncbi:MAG: DUF1549 and DUF1553 domain-containing protein [Phycisphaeraceae bacterium]